MALQLGRKFRFTLRFMKKTAESLEPRTGGLPDFAHVDGSVAEEFREDGLSLPPIACLALQLSAAGAGQFVVFRFAIVVGDSPCGLDRTLLFQFQQSRI